VELQTKWDSSVEQKFVHIENGDRTASITLTNDAIMVAHKTLGTWKSAAHNNQVKQVEELVFKSNEYVRVIMASPITWVNNWTAYHAIYLPRMTFVLLTSYLSKQHKLQKIEQCAIGTTQCMPMMWTPIRDYISWWFDIRMSIIISL
jgi:hypothetical protein